MEKIKGQDLYFVKIVPINFYFCRAFEKLLLQTKFSTPLFEKLNIILAQYPGARRRWFGSYFLRFHEKQKNVTSTQICKTTYLLILRVRTVLTTKHLVSKDIKGPTSRSGWRFQPECPCRVFEGEGTHKGKSVRVCEFKQNLANRS